MGNGGLPTVHDLPGAHPTKSRRRTVEFAHFLPVANAADHGATAWHSLVPRFASS
jgi:hypothetical protein